MTRFGAGLHAAVARVVPLDVTRVLVRRAGGGPGGGAGGGLAGAAPACVEVDAVRLKGHVATGALEASPALVGAIAAGRVRCFAALDADGHPIGHDFLAVGEVPARWNAGGHRFRGIGISLPPDVAYLFKAWVAPAHRGCGVHGALLRHALGELDAAGCLAVVTTADWTNTASLAGFARVGFERRGLAVEAVIAGRHAVRVPGPIEVVPGRRVTMHRSAADAA